MHDLLRQTFSRFPQFDGQDIEVLPLEKGGSDRNFYRIALSDGASLILAKYGTQRDENRHYVTIARFLAEVGVRVPKIFFHDDTEGLIWMEDLGDRDLWSYRHEPWPVRRALYQSALDQLVILHLRGHLAHDGQSPRLQAPFDAELYRWEQQYFLENCLGRYFKLSADQLDGPRSRLAEIAHSLAALPRRFVHRDFQSQNIVVKQDAACLIDFQGMRYGLGQYDLASVLWDPYVTLTDPERNELQRYYVEQLALQGQPAGSDFVQIFDLCAMQRLMQALGAYGFLGLVKERPHFLEHIPAALANLQQVVARIPGLESLAGTLSTLQIPSSQKI